uniref:Uncharacterized protein n=1 Tax=Globodera rostochiensis TaxID=31243 RepID=A0A914H4I2_GLORO
MNFFCWIIILIGSIHASLGNDFSFGQNLSKIDHIQQLIQKLRGTMEEGADWTNQSYSLMSLLLLEECKLVENVEIPAKISNNQLKLEVDRNCAALKSGKLLSNKSVITDKMALALQTDGQKMVAHLKRIEKEQQITVDGMHGTLVEIFSRAQEHTESKKLLLFVVLFKLLRQKIVEMSAGPAKNAIQTVLAQNSVAMPISMIGHKYALNILEVEENEDMQLIQKEEGTDWTKQADSQIESMLLEECQFVKNHGKIAKFVVKNAIMLGAEHGCQSLLKGELFSDGTELVEKVTLAFQTGDQKLIENLKRKEIGAKIAVDGGGTLAEILPLTKVGNILRMLEAKMSAGPAKDAVQNLLAQNSVVMPSDMVQLVMNLWKIYSHNHVYVNPQIRREHPRTRRKRDNGMQRILTELGSIIRINV